MDLQMLKAIIESLRNPANKIPSGIDRTGSIPRRMSAGTPITADANRNINYVKYMRQQEAMGESPVNYEEWMQGQ